MKKNSIINMIISIPLFFNIYPIQREQSLNCYRIEKKVSIKYIDKNEKYNNLILKANRIEKERKKREQEKKEKLKKMKEEKKQSEKRNNIISRGIEISKEKEINFEVTYYTNIENKLEGGSNDKRGKALTSHNQPVCALPSDVPYGSYVVFNEPVNGSKIYKVVDTGGAIKWQGPNTTKIDIFIPNKSIKYIEKNHENKVVKGVLYYVQK